MDAGDLKWRGATSAPFPGYLLIGRGEDFATTLTSASADVIDQFAETLCEGSDLKYMYNGECLDMELFEAGTLGGEPVEFYTTVHGPVTGYATVDGEKVAISRQRSGYGEDVVDLLFNRRISNGSVENYEDFFDAAAQTPQTFNSFYIDHEHVAEYTAGKLPIRNKNVDPGLLTDGQGDYEWEGVLDAEGPPARHRPRGRDDDQLERDGRARLLRRGRELRPQRLGHARRPPRREPEAAQGLRRQVGPGRGDRGDERRRDPGRAGDPHRAAPPRAAHARCRSVARGAAGAAGDGPVERGRRQPPRPATSTARSIIRAPRSWIARGRRSRTRSWSRSSAASSTSSRRSSAATTCRPAASTRAGTSTSSATSASSSGTRSRSRSRTTTAAHGDLQAAATRSGARSRRRSTS